MSRTGKISTSQGTEGDHPRWHAHQVSFQPKYSFPAIARQLGPVGIARLSRDGRRAIILDVFSATHMRKMVPRRSSWPGKILTVILCVFCSIYRSVQSRFTPSIPINVSPSTYTRLGEYKMALFQPACFRSRKPRTVFSGSCLFPEMSTGSRAFGFCLDACPLAFQTDRSESSSPTTQAGYLFSSSLARLTTFFLRCSAAKVGKWVLADHFCFASPSHPGGRRSRWCLD
jgi:hypothetical protein